METIKMSRLFFALWPDDLTRRKIATVAAQLPHRGNKIKAANFHTTLAFLGEIPTDQIQTYIDAADQVITKPFNLKLDAREWWQQSQITCLSISEWPEPLFDLLRSLNETLIPCGYNPGQRPFRPHMTLMRNVKHPISPIYFEPIYWLVRGFSLIESESHPFGVEYRVIQSWDFVG